MEPVPVFFRVTVPALVVLTTTLPKFSVVGEDRGKQAEHRRQRQQNCVAELPHTIHSKIRHVETSPFHQRRQR